MKLVKMLTPPVKASVISFAFLAAIAFPLSVFADYTIWSGKNAVWQDDSTWWTSRDGGGNFAPIEGEEVYLRPKDAGAGVTNTLSLSSDLTLGTRVVAWWSFQNGGGPGAYSFDGNGHTFLTPDYASDGPYNPDNAYRFTVRSYSYGYFLEVLHGGNSPNDGFMRLEDPHFTVFDHGTHFGIDIDRGVYDFYEPDGTLHGSSISLKIGGGNSAGTELDFTVRGQDTVMKAYTIQPDLSFPSNRFTITDGATIEAPSNGYFRAANVNTVAERWVTLSKGATIRNGTTTGWFGKSGTRNGMLHFSMTDSAIDSLSSFSFYGDGELSLSNSTIACYGPTFTKETGVYNWDQPYEYKGLSCGENTSSAYTQHWHFADCTIKASAPAVGNMTPGGAETAYVSNVMERVHIVMFNGMSWGSGYHYVTNLTVTRVNEGAWGCNLGPGAIAVFEDVNLSGRRLNVGNYSQQITGTSPSRLYVQHGTVPADMLAMGLNYPSYAHVRDGGTMNAITVRLAGSNSDSATDTYRTNAKDATLYIEKGGTLKFKELYGHNNALCRGGTAKATVIGDGGTMTPRTTPDAGAKFVHDLDAFEITGNGLTLEMAKYTLAWQQNVADKAGEAGRFTVRGKPEGVLTVTDSLFSVTETEVDGATVVFAAGAEVSGKLVPDSGTTVRLQSGSEVSGALAPNPGATVQIQSGAIVSGVLAPGRESAVSVESGATLSGDLVLTNGARVVFVAGAMVNLKNLIVDDGVIALDPSVAINVSGEISLHKLQIEYTTPPMLDQAINTLVLAGEADEEVIESWKDAVLATRFTDGTYARYDSTYDSGLDRTTFSVTKKNEATPIPAAGDKVWTGTGAWATESNWNPTGVPAAENRAVFSSESAGFEVAVSVGDETGALEFNADQKYTIVGETLKFTSEQGAATLDVKKGEHEIAASLELSQRVDITVDAETKLTVSGAISGGALKKTGKGALVISGANDFKEGVALSGGRNTVCGDGLVKSHAGASADVVHLGNDTFELDETASGNFGSALSFEGEDNDFPIVIKNDGDMYARVAGSTGGSFLKHGAGELTLDFGATSMNWPAGHGGLVKNMTPLSATPLLTLPENGVIDGLMTNYLWSLTVASGTLRLKGDSQSTKLTPPANPAGYFVGSEFSDWSAVPELIVDGLTFQGVGNLQFGYNAGAGARSRCARIQVLNGGLFQFGTFFVGNGCWSGDRRPELTVAVTNATFVNSSGSSIAMPRKASNGTAVWRCKDSEICYRAPMIQGHIDAIYDHCVMNNWYEPDAYWKTTEFAYGTVEFCNGTVLYARGFRMNWDNKETPYTTDGLTFVWDDARLAHKYAAAKGHGTMAPEWWDESRGGTASNLVIDASCCRTSLFSMEFKGKGMTVATPEGYSLTLGVPLKGEAGITQYGAGLTIIKDGAWQFKGTMNLVGGGTLDVTQHGTTIANAKIGGSGTVTGGTFQNLTVDRREGADVVTLENAALTGRMKVDLGVNELAAPLALFRISGTTKPVNGQVKVFGLDGERLAGTVSTVGDVVTLTSVYKPGTLILVR